MGRPRLSNANLSLSVVFFKLRTCQKNTPLYHSLMRLARTKIKNEHPDLTDQERHEIICVWSRSDCQLYKSPALEKILKIESSGVKNPVALYRQKFDQDGKSLKEPKIDHRQMKLSL